MNQIATPNGPLTIRPALESDAPRFRELRLEALRRHPEAFSADLLANERQPPEHWQGRLRDLGERGMIYFAEHDTVLAGMTGIARGYSPKTEHSATIWGVYVRPEWRGQQVATALLEACLEWAHRHGVRVVKLAVITTNAAAIRLYLRSGFQVYGVEPDALEYEEKTYDELLMVRR